MYGIAGFVLLVLIDAFVYGIMYEGFYLSRDYGFRNVGIWAWCYERGEKFWEWLFNGVFGEVPRYRNCQKLGEVMIMALVFLFSGPMAVVGMLWGFYWMANEMGYYIVLGQVWMAREYRNASWLSNWYQSGWWIFREGYSWTGFVWSALIGAAGLVFWNLVQW